MSGETVTTVPVAEGERGPLVVEVVEGITLEEEVVVVRIAVLEEEDVVVVDARGVVEEEGTRLVVVDEADAVVEEGRVAVDDSDVVSAGGLAINWPPWHTNDPADVEL